MIAPIEGPKATASSPGVRHARRLVASTLLKRRSHPTDRPGLMSAGRAWLLTAWVVVVAAVYFVCMAGLL